MAVTVTNAGGITTVTLSAAGDTASPQNIINAGFGVLTGRLVMSSAHTIRLRIAKGATYDETGWTTILASGRHVEIDCAYGGGKWLKGYRRGQRVQGGAYISAGAWGATNGGQAIFVGNAAAGNEPIIEWYAVTLDSGTTNNRQPTLYADRNAVLDIKELTLANQSQAGANAGLVFDLGTVDGVNAVRCLISLGGEGSLSGLTLTGLNQGADVRIFPRAHNQVVSRFEPGDFNEFWFGAHTIAAPPAGEVRTLNLDDPVFPAGFDWAASLKKYGPEAELNARRTIELLLKDSGGTAVTGTRVYAASGAVGLANKVAAGDFIEAVPFWTGSWNFAINDYRFPSGSQYTNAQTFNVRKYGFVYESFTFDIREQGVSQPIFLREIDFLLSEADVDALAGINLDFGNKVALITQDCTTTDLFSFYLRQLETAPLAGAPVEWESQDGTSVDFGDWSILVDGSVLDGSVLTAGNVNLQNGGTITGAVEDANGVRVTVTKTDGGNFNIYARSGTQATGFTDLGFTEDTDSITYTVAKGEPVEIAMWALGFETFSRTIQTANGGVSFVAEMRDHEFVDTTIDVTQQLAAVELQVFGPIFRVIVAQPLVINDVEVLKGVVHRLSGLEDALRIMVPPGNGSLITFRADEIQVNAPLLELALTDDMAKIGTTDKVYLDVFFNTAPALNFNPNYILNPVRMDGNFVNIIRVKPQLDPFYLVSEMTRQGIALEDSVKAIPVNPLLTNDARLGNLDGKITSRPTLAQIEATAVLAKAAKVAEIKTAADAIKVETDKLPALKTVADAVKTQTDKLTFTGENLHAVAKLVEDKAGYALTVADKEAIAVAVEQAILDEDDGRKILEAIVAAIGNQNIDQVALTAAIRADLERTGGSLDLLPTLTEIEGSAVLAKEATTASRLAAADYVAPDNASIAAIGTKVDGIQVADLTTVQNAIVEVKSAQATINEGVKKASLLIPHTADVGSGGTCPTDTGPDLSAMPTGLEGVTGAFGTYEIKPEYLWQDVDRTIPVTSDGDPVAFVQDLSGMENHLKQEVTANRPVYRTDGTYGWIQTNGVNQSIGAFLTKPIASGDGGVFMVFEPKSAADTAVFGAIFGAIGSLSLATSTGINDSLLLIGGGFAESGRFVLRFPQAVKFSKMPLSWVATGAQVAIKYAGESRTVTPNTRRGYMASFGVGLNGNRWGAIDWYGGVLIEGTIDTETQTKIETYLTDTTGADYS